mgnify:CR=1 FL=1|jgi:hypothetical protein
MNKVLYVSLILLSMVVCFVFSKNSYAISHKKQEKIVKEIQEEYVLGNMEEVRELAGYLVRKTENKKIHHMGAVYLTKACMEQGLKKEAIRSCIKLNTHCHSSDTTCPAPLQHVEAYNLLYRLTARKKYLDEGERILDAVNNTVRLSLLKAKITNERLSGNDPLKLAELYKEFLRLNADPTQEELMVCYLAFRDVFDPGTHKIFNKLSLDNQKLLTNENMAPTAQHFHYE